MEKIAIFLETLLKTWKSIPIQEINHHFSRECGFSINPQEFGFKNLDDLVEDVLILCPETLRIEDGSVKSDILHNAFSMRLPPMPIL